MLLTSDAETASLNNIRINHHPFVISNLHVHHNKHGQLIQSGCTAEGRFSEWKGLFSLPHVRNGFRAQPASYPTGTRSSLVGGGGKGSRAWNKQLPSIYCRSLDFVEFYLHTTQTPSRLTQPPPPASFTGWCEIGSQSGDRLSWMTFLVDFLIPSRNDFGTVP